MTSTPSVIEVDGPGNSQNYFHPVDYVVLSLMLLFSASIGVFFAVRARRRKLKSTNDYLMASRGMTFGPVSLSLLASFMSSVTILGLPAEYYVYGTMFTWFGLVYIVVPIIISCIFIPVFYDLGISSVYEYLELRFSKVARIVVTCLYLLVSFIYGGIVTYGPALALSKVTGLHMWGSILCTGAVCMFYTSLGGLKAVIWTDVLQCILMISGFIIVIIQGSINLGGFGNIWRIAEEGDRLDFVHFEVDPRIRHTFWSILIGGTILWTALYGVNQSQVQRYMCCRDKKDAVLACALNSVGLIVILVLAGMTGLTIYATYVDCDPINSGQVSKADQLFPYIVMDIVGHLPGVPGLFVSAVFSSCLSTVSSGINAMACVALEDFVRPVTKWRETTYIKLSKILVIVFGFLYILMAYMASEIGGLIRMAYGIHGIIGGPVLGIFTLGILFPWVNHYGAVSGIFAGIITAVWVFIGSTLYPPTPEFTRPMPRSTDGCNPGNLVEYANFSTDSYNQTTATTTFMEKDVVHLVEEERPPIANFYMMSYLHYGTVGFMATLLVGMLVSSLTGFTKENKPEESLLATFLREEKDSKNTSKDVEYTEMHGAKRSTSWSSPGRISIPGSCESNRRMHTLIDTEITFKVLEIPIPDEDKESAF